MDILFFSSLALLFLAAVGQFAGTVFKKERLQKAAWLVFLLSFSLLTLYMIVRGVRAGRLPLSNQFEFGSAFAWAIGIMLLVLRIRRQADWLTVAALPMAFLVLSYAALQPREITDLMPALRSAWFGFHIGSAVLAYAAFIVAGSVGLRYLSAQKKETADELRLQQMDYMSYRMIAFGFLMLTVTILSGAIWAEQAWSAFWTWDPKEVWALITWIIYAVYLHLRLRVKRRGRPMALYAAIAVPVVLFTFAGVNWMVSALHLGSLHTYG